MNPKKDSISFCCGKRTKVIDSRPALYGLRRRRLCGVCGRRVTTMEVFAKEDTSHTQVANDMAMLSALSEKDRHSIRAMMTTLYERTEKH